jgi:hypothetical protein
MSGRTDTDLFLVVNGVQFPCPVRDYEIVRSQLVDSGRNANGAVVGQKVGRKLWKINNLHWRGLSAETWAAMQAALEPFFVDVTFTGDDNVRHTVKMYPGDTTAKPYYLNGILYDVYEYCKFNLIDCGW